MGFFFITVMIEPAVAADEIVAVFAIKPVVVMIVIGPVLIMPMPCRIAIVGISGIG
jgi:hypothetical protein